MRRYTYPFLALIDIVIMLLCRLLLNRIVALFADKAGNLPRRLKWFQTFDNDLDAGTRSRQWELAAGLDGDTWAAFNPDPQSWFAIYRNRVKWLWRNPGYGFDYYLLGMPFDPKEWTVVEYIDTPERTYFKAIGPKGAFNEYEHGPDGMYKYGWKAWNMFDTGTRTWKTSPWGPEWRVPIVFSPIPFKRK
jgi:hypothetical protein